VALQSEFSVVCLQPRCLSVCQCEGHSLTRLPGYISSTALRYPWRWLCGLDFGGAIGQFNSDKSGRF
jgi:hypothetical protein